MAFGKLGARGGFGGLGSLGGAAASLYLGQVATRSWVTNKNNATLRYGMWRRYHFSRDALVSGQWRLVFPNWWVNASFAEAGSGGTLTLTASIEYPASTFTQITFSASATASVASGDMIVSDPINVSIPTNTKFWSRAYTDNATGGILYTDFIDKTNGDAANFSNSSVTTTDQTMSGTVGVAQNGACYGPCAIIQMTRKASVYFLGDSIAEYYDDTADATGDVGYLARVIGPTLPYLNGGVAGDSIQKFVASHAQRVILANYCSAIIFESSVNDVSSGRTAAQIEADLVTAAGYFTTQKKVLVTTFPRTNSSDLYATLVNQTDFNGTGMGYRNTLNIWKRTLPSPFTALWDISPIIEDLGDSTRWLTDGSANTYTDDGVHPSHVGHLLIANSGVCNLSAVRR